MTAVTALAEVDISNMALSNLGISIGIQSFNDKTAEAKACAFWYPKARDQLLKSAPWNFAYLAQSLASDGSNVAGTLFAYPGWRYAYQYPNDCLQAIAVTTVYGQRMGQYYWASYWGYPYAQGLNAFPKIPFRIVQSTAVQGQKAILTDIPAPAYLWYVSCVTDTAMFDSLFCDGLSQLLSAKIGGPLRASVEKIQAANAGAKSACLSALAQCMNEAQQDPERVSPSISIR
ncbi:MAG: hypothetical protein JWO52_7834 [Gammaproteobacteria bacterium]|nr:hypothetical protein [Gammaproteobacteria bacterium]